MFKTNKFPVHLILIFENLNILHWTSSTLKPNHSLTLWPLKSLVTLTKITKYELVLSNSYLIDGSIIDTTNYNLCISDVDHIFKNKKNILFYTFHFYYISHKITFFFYLNNYTNSIENSYKNACWVEREMKEMYGYHTYNKVDGRNLLLDYTNLDNPLKKEYPCVGLNELFYNNLEEGIIAYPNTTVEAY